MLSVVTFNIWGLPFFTYRKEDRVRAIGNYLNEKDFDIICLQEVFVKSNFDVLQNILYKKYKYYFYCGGGGIAIFSKYKMLNCDFNKFLVSGEVGVVDVEWVVDKGVAFFQIEVAGETIDIYTTHLYSDHFNKTAVYRWLQAIELLEYINKKSGCNPIILCGDLNFEDNSLEYKLVTTFFKDAWKEFYGNKKGNTFKINPQRIDYIMYCPKFELEYVSLEFEDNISMGDDVFAFSDHYGVGAKFKRHIHYDANSKLSNIDSLNFNVKTENYIQLHKNIANQIRQDELKSKMCWRMLFTLIILYMIFHTKILLFLGMIIFIVCVNIHRRNKYMRYLNDVFYKKLN